MPKRLDGEIVAEVHRLTARGYTIDKIAAQVGIKYESVQYLRRTSMRPVVIETGDEPPLPKSQKPPPKPRPPKKAPPPQIGATIRELAGIAMGGEKGHRQPGSPGNTRMQNAITSHTIERIRNLAITGLTSSEIAAATGVLINTVEHVQGRPHNPRGCPQKIADDLIELIHTLSHRGLPASDIATQIGISYQTVLRYIKEPPDPTREERRRLMADQIIFHLRGEFPDRWQSIAKLPGRERRAWLNEIANTALSHAEDLFGQPGKYADEQISERGTDPVER